MIALIQIGIKNELYDSSNSKFENYLTLTRGSLKE